jgi:hypothetical protein
MGTTYLHAVASLDGYIADERDDVGPLHDWYFKGDHPLVDEDHADVHGAPFRVSAASADYVRDMWSRQKVLVVAAPIRPDQRVGGPPAGERPRRGRVAPTAADGLAPGGVVPLRHLGGGGNRASTGAGWRGGDWCGRG